MTVLAVSTLLSEMSKVTNWEHPFVIASKTWSNEAPQFFKLRYFKFEPATHFFFFYKKKKKMRQVENLKLSYPPTFELRLRLRWRGFCFRQDWDIPRRQHLHTNRCQIRPPICHKRIPFTFTLSLNALNRGTNPSFPILQFEISKLSNLFGVAEMNFASSAQPYPHLIRNQLNELN